MKVVKSILCSAAAVGLAAGASTFAADEVPDMMSDGEVTYYIYELDDGTGIEDAPTLLIIEEEPIG